MERCNLSDNSFRETKRDDFFQFHDLIMDDLTAFFLTAFLISDRFFPGMSLFVITVVRRQIA